MVSKFTRISRPFCLNLTDVGRYNNSGISLVTSSSLHCGQLYEISRRVQRLCEYDCYCYPFSLCCKPLFLGYQRIGRIQGGPKGPRPPLLAEQKKRKKGEKKRKRRRRRRKRRKERRGERKEEEEEESKERRKKTRR